MRDLKKILKLRASNKSQRFIADSENIQEYSQSDIFIGRPETAVLGEGP